MRRILCLTLFASLSLSVHAALPRSSKSDRGSGKRVSYQKKPKPVRQSAHKGKKKPVRLANGRKGKKPQRVAQGPSKYGGSCRKGGSDKMSNSMYFLPVEGKTKNLKYHTSMQGSALLSNGQVRTFTGKVVNRAAGCETTDTSATGACLMSYFSVAADLEFHEAGDIIYVPEIAEKKIKIRIPETGEEIVHPGYFVVQDTGGVIKGPNRFDFFTGTDYPMTKGNPFKEIGMGDKFACDKRFVKIPRGSAQARQALAMIDKLSSDAPHTELAGEVKVPPAIGVAESTQ